MCFGVLEVTLEFDHQDVEVSVGGETRAALEQSRAAQRRLRVMHHIQQLRRLACNTAGGLTSGLHENIFVT